MSRLIDADELMNIAEETALAWEYRRIVSDIRSIIEKAPTIDPDDLRPSGRWVPHDDEMFGISVECSACHAETCGTSPYCPACGARMEVYT